MRFSIFALATLVVSSAVAANIVSGEIPVTGNDYEASNRYPAVAAGVTRLYTSWGIYPKYYGMEMTSTLKPSVDTQKLLGNATDSSDLKVFAAGDTFYVSGQDENGRFLRRVDDGATLRGLTTVAMSYNGSRILLEGSQAEIRDLDLNLVVPNLPTGVLAARTAAGGKFYGVTHTSSPSLISIDGDGHVQTLATNLPSGTIAQLAANGAELLYVWSYLDAIHIYAQRFSFSGAPLSDVFEVGPTDGTRFKTWYAASAGGDFFVAWNDVAASEFANDTSMSYRRVSGSTATAPVLFGRVATERYYMPPSRLIGSPAGVFIVWGTAGVTFPTMMIRRIDVDSGPQPLFVTLPAQTEVRVASDGVTAMVGWVSNGRVHIGRVDGDGNPLDGGGLYVAFDSDANQHLDGIVFGGVDYLVLFHTGFPGTATRLYARIVRRDGTFSTDVLSLLPASDYVANSGAVWTGSTYRVFWDGTQVLRYVDITTPGIVSPPGEISRFFRFYGPFDVVWGPRPLYVPQSGNAGVFLDDLSVFDIPKDPIQLVASVGPAAANATSYLIASQTVGSNSASAWVRRFDMQGKPIDAPLLVATSTVSAVPAVPIRDGAKYKVVVFGATLKIATVDDHAFACRCLDDAAEVPVTAHLGSFSAAAAGPDRIAIAYTHVDGTGGRERAYIRFARTGPPPRHRAAGR